MSLVTQPLAMVALLFPAGANARVPVLLIASNANGERTIDQVYRDRIGRTASLWYLPDTGHTRGLSAHPTPYAARVDAFLTTALAGR
jgi:hypothetical protein